MSEKHVSDVYLTNPVVHPADLDLCYVEVKSGGSYVSGATQYQNIRPKLGSVTYVDSVSGNDSTALAGSFVHRFLTVQAALNAAALSSNAKNLEVFAGTYAESLVLKNNVNIFLHGGSLINSIGVAAQDGGQPVACTISGPGKINGVTAGLQLTNASSNVLAINREISASGGQPIILQDATLAVSAKLRSTWNNASGGCILRQGNGGVLTVEPPCAFLSSNSQVESIMSANIASGSSYSGAGTLSIAVVAGQRYFVNISGSPDISLVNGATTYGTGGLGFGVFTFVASASSVALTGTPSASCGVILRRVFDLKILGYIGGTHALGTGNNLICGAYEENSNYQ